MRILDSVLIKSIINYSLIKSTNPYYRIGQSLFNTLYEINPILAEEIRGTNKDPYHCDNWDDIRVTKFLLILNKYK